ncbi:MAG: SPOR domain-containing protein [Dysgonamonadaceae bacterium]|jgi:cell division protein FtsN|nr:SPOR domain-containing protein [Dysgonamonadaceae bacterium]
MKSTGYLAGLMCVLAIAFSGCKPKQSAYQKVYEAAQSRPTVYQSQAAPAPAYTPAPAAPVYAPAPVPQAAPANATFQTERVTAVDGRGIRKYSVVIGSFLNKTNAESLKNRMQNYGYTPVLAQNEKGMYRVIVATFDDKSDAYIQRDAVKERYPEFYDAWLLERLY